MCLGNAPSGIFQVDTLKSWLASNSSSEDSTFVRLSLAGLLAESPATRSEAANLLSALGPEVRMDSISSVWMVTLQISMGRPEAVRQRFGAHSGDTAEDRAALRNEITEVNHTCLLLPWRSCMVSGAELLGETIVGRCSCGFEVRLSMSLEAPRGCPSHQHRIYDRS